MDKAAAFTLITFGKLPWNSETNVGEYPFVICGFLFTFPLSFIQISRYSESPQVETTPLVDS